MAFPDTPIIESGTGADASPLTGWTDSPSNVTFGGLRRISNQLASITTDSWDYYATGGNFGPYSQVYATFPVMPAANGFELGINTQDIGTATYDQYSVSARSTDIRIIRYDNGGAAVIATHTRTISAGDSVGLQLSPNRQIAYYKPSGGSWTPVIETFDTTFPNIVGPLTLYIPDTTGRVTNVGGGSLGSFGFVRRAI